MASVAGLCMAEFGAFLYDLSANSDQKKDLETDLYQFDLKATE